MKRECVTLCVLKMKSRRQRLGRTLPLTLLWLPFHVLLDFRVGIRHTAPARNTSPRSSRAGGNQLPVALAGANFYNAILFCYNNVYFHN